MAKMEFNENYEFVKELAMLISKKEQEFKGVRVVVPENYNRFLIVYSYFKGFAKKYGGKVTYTDTDPSSVHGGMTLEVPLVDLYHDHLSEFVKVLGLVDVFGINPTSSGEIMLDVTVNNLWETVASDE